MAFCGFMASKSCAFPAASSCFASRISRARGAHHRDLSACLGVSPGGERETGDGEPFSKFHLKTQGNGVETIQLLESGEKGSVANSSDVVKLFNDVQQNMLYLNKQRLMAVEDLQKAERERELLLAKIGLLEAETEASAVECDVLQRQLEGLKSKYDADAKLDEAGRRALKNVVEPPSVFSELLLRIDSMVLTGAISAGQASALRKLALNKDSQAAEILFSIQTEDDKELASSLLPLLNPNRRYQLHVTHICTELDPIVKSGALGTSVMGLSRALRRKGNLVEVILPKYATINMDHVQNLRETPVDFYSFYDGQWHKNKIWTGVVYGIAVTFIEPLHPGGLFSREHLYDYSDDFERFTYFCRASLEYIVKSGKQPDILHLHNWQTAAVAPLFWDVFASQQGLGGTRILFTCHDFKYQCVQEPAKLALCGLDPQRLHRADRLQDNLDPRLVNILKGGLIYSNKVTTVSPMYALDVMTREHGHGLESTLITHKSKFLGIYNGLDGSIWNPRDDPFLPSTYSSENLVGKGLCKSHLLKQLGLQNTDDSIPLIGCLAPQVSEHEVELIKAAFDCAMMQGSKFVFIGESKIKHVQMIIEDLQLELEEKGGRALVKYDESMAHLVLAASDILICVSVNEPTAQLPLISMQYGSIPVTRQQGGFNGSFVDADDVSHQSEANAFIFRSATGPELIAALSRAIDCLTKDSQKWRKLMQNAMSKDFSWDAGCLEEYLAAYWSIKQL